MLFIIIATAVAVGGFVLGWQMGSAIRHVACQNKGG